MTEEKVSSMYGQRYTASEASSMTVMEEMDLKVYGTMDEGKVECAKHHWGLLNIVTSCHR